MTCLRVSPGRRASDDSQCERLTISLSLLWGKFWVLEVFYKCWWIYSPSCLVAEGKSVQKSARLRVTRAAETQERGELTAIQSWGFSPNLFSVHWVVSGFFFFTCQEVKNIFKNKTSLIFLCGDILKGLKKLLRLKLLRCKIISGMWAESTSLLVSKGTWEGRWRGNLWQSILQVRPVQKNGQLWSYPSVLESIKGSLEPTLRRAEVDDFSGDQFCSSWTPCCCVSA